MSKQTLNTSNSMALEQPRGAFGKVSIVFATKLKSFTFLPVLKKLPTENRVKSVWKKGSSKRNEALGDHEAAEGKTFDEGTFNAKVVYVSDMEPQEMTKHSETQKSTTKSAIAPLPIPAVAHGEISCTSPKTHPGTLDTVDNKHSRTPQLGCHNTEAEVSSGLILDSESQREEEVLSPVSSVDIFTSPFSSKESILSEGWEQETGWSALQMLSPSGSVSPCSSVRSGAFTPSVLRIKCHKLAPGSCLMQMPLTSCQTLGCNRHITSPCPLSTRARHRPPPTQLSLLTAILRKGRLPVLSSALQRPYSPCWPISPVNMSSCLACSAASNVAPMVGLRAKSCLSKGKNCTELSCKARPKPPGLISKTEPVSPKDQNKGRRSLTAVETSDAIDSNTNAARSRIISMPEGISSLTMSSYSPSEPPPAHLSKQSHKDIHVSTDPSLMLGSPSSRLMSLSPESNLDQGNGHKSNDTSPIVRKTKPCQASSSDLKLVQMAHERSPTPDHKPIQQSQDILASAVPKYIDVRPGSHLRNYRKISQELEKIHSVSPVFQHSPSPRVAGLTHLADTPSISPVLLSPRPGSCTSTSGCNTLSSSPAVPYHHLSPSPSYSLCSSPTPSQRDSTPDCIDRGSKKPYKIKSTYKALAAIPTNTLLLEQQAIDDEVDKNNAPLDPSDSFAWEDPHSQMCSPAQLRQQSKELYQVIDEVLKDTNQARPSSSTNKLTAKSVASEATRKLTPSPRSLGRETKYATFHLQPPAHAEKTLTKPGVIRPAIVMSRLDDDKEKSCFSNTYQKQQDRFSTDHQNNIASSTLSTKDEPHGRGDLEGEKESSEVREKCMSSSILVKNQAREYSTPSPRGMSL
ncbi:muscular LMNA-interacting protein isoform X2 [Ictalurus punctatus]|uniref:Muscular LMNA-interacting protein isoform X2 n=1 Tax=Ictalurus punctatus TaxID=7998 RepID=A0A2D0QRE1_ICTPU|nr:muscular LMNA-interacting protein isoform X2 [Ictalurus punctatus]